MNNEISDLLRDREKTHGDFSTVAYLAQVIKTDLREGGNNWDDLAANQQEALDMIATKMARIVCGDFTAADHWLDIEGYARLARECLNK